MDLKSLHKTRIEELNQFKKNNLNEANRIDSYQKTLAGIIRKCRE
jgi:hypothetical protein